MKPSTVARGVGFTSKRTRARLVYGLKNRGILNDDVLKAIENVPRHQFVDEALASRAYEDIPLPIGYHQTISQPFIVALMTEKLIAGSSSRKSVLEIGTGCGYQTAILARLFERVYSIERIKPLLKRADNTLTELLIDNVELRHGDGYIGWKGRPAFDSIILTAASESVPQKILAQLASGGCLIAPVGEPENQRLRIVNNRHGLLYEEDSEPVRFVPLLKGVSR